MPQEEGTEWRERQEDGAGEGGSMSMMFSLLIASPLTAGKASPPHPQDPKLRLLLLVPEQSERASSGLCYPPRFLVPSEKPRMFIL